MKITTAQLVWCLGCLSAGSSAHAQAQPQAPIAPTPAVTATTTATTTPTTTPSTTPAPAPVTTTDEAQRTAIARAMFDEGLRFVDAEKWSDAADRFARVLEIRYSTVAAYNYGLAEARLGKLVVAAETLRKLTADEALDPKVRDPAIALRKEVDSKVGWLTLKVEGDSTSCTLHVDEQLWPAAAWGVAVPIDPGTHAIVIMRGAHSLRTQTLDVQPGQHLEQTIEASMPAPTPAQVAATAIAADDGRERTAEPEKDTPRARGGLLRNPWFWVAVGVVAAGAIATAVVVAAPSDAKAPAVTGNFSPGSIEGTVMP